MNGMRMPVFLLYRGRLASFRLTCSDSDWVFSLAEEVRLTCRLKGRNWNSAADQMSGPVTKMDETRETESERIEIAVLVCYGKACQFSGIGLYGERRL